MPCLATSLYSEVLVNLDATALPVGPLNLWTNAGSLAGDFAADAGGAPQVETISGVKAVTLTGNADFFIGPIAPAAVTGVNPNRSIEVWAYNPEIAGEETLVAWGRRGGGDGTNLAFNYGNNGSFGAVGHWGAPDIGWNDGGGAPSAGVWHHLVYTYDGGGAPGAGTTRVYADGVLMNSEFLGSLSTHAGFPILIGAQSNADAPNAPQGFNSGLSIAKVRVHDVALSIEQIQDAYAAELPSFRPGETFVLGPYLTQAKVANSNSFSFTVQDRVTAPASAVNPTTFSVRLETHPATFKYVTTPRRGWQADGGEGVISGSITSPAITVPNADGLKLSLTHRHNFEGDLYDGGVVQVSKNNGPFVTLGAENFSAESYTPGAIIGNGFLRGGNAWNGASAGFDADTFLTSVATVPGLASGDIIRIRMAAAWDDGFTPDGIDWEITGLKVEAGATTVLDQDFSTGDGGFTTASLGALQASKTGTTTLFTLPADWLAGTPFNFTLIGKNTVGGDVSIPASIGTPPLRTNLARTWPVSLPGPQGTAARWGVRTYLNEGINSAENLDAMMEFLASAADRTPALTPDTVVDTMEQDLSFRDSFTNGAGGPAGTLRDFPGEALSLSTNGGVSRDDNHVISVAHGSIQITEADDYTFSFRGDDGFFFRIRAASGAPPAFIGVNGGGTVDFAQPNVIFFPDGTGDTNTRAITYLTPGTYKLEYATWEGGGGFFYQVAAAQGFYPNHTDTTAWRPIGYTFSSPPSMAGPWTVDSTLSGVTVGSNAAADASVDAAILADPAAARSTWPSINFQDDGGGESSERITGSALFPRLDDGVANDNFALRAAGTLRIASAGNYLIGFQGDDGSRLRIGGNHAGFTALTENATGASIIGTANSPVANSGSLGAAGNSSPDTGVTFGQAGAIVASTDTAIAVDAAAGSKVSVPFSAALNPATGTGAVAPFTVECWAKPAGLEGGAQAVVNSMIAGVNQNPANADERSGYVLRLNNGNWQFYLGLENGGAFYEIATAEGSAVEGAWQHVVGVYDGTDSRLYINGVELATLTIAEPIKANYAAPLLLGKRGFGDWRFNGGIDEVAVYGTALSAATILSHYENGVSAAPATPYSALVLASSPVGYWRLNETLQPRVDLGSLNYDAALSGDSSTVGRIFLNPGDYPISALFWEAGGGASFEIFAAADTPVPAFKILTSESVTDVPGLPVVSPPTPVTPVLLGQGLIRNPDNTLSLSVQTVPYGIYSLEASGTLVNWQTIQEFEATGTTTTINGTTDGPFRYKPNVPGEFFRVRAQP